MANLILVALSIIGLGAPSRWMPGTEFKNDNTSPVVVLPGDTLRITVDHISTIGNWNVESSLVNSIPIKIGDNEKYLWQPENMRVHQDKE